MEIVVAIISLVVSVVLAIYYFRDRKRAAFELESQYSEELMDWHAAVVEVLVRLRDLCRPIEELEHRSDLAHLSSLIEQGRFYFPNIDRKDGFGSDKPAAYRGYRNLALDFLVASYNVLQEASSKQRNEEALLLQRYFTSIVFEVVRPNDRLEAIRSHTDRYFVLNKSFDDFLEHKDGSVINHIWTVPNQRK
jgi:hypothetical protein